MRRPLLAPLLMGLFIACDGGSPSEPIIAGDTKDYTVEGRVTQADDPTAGISGVALLISTNVLGEYVGTETDDQGHYHISFRRRCRDPGITIHFIPGGMTWQGEMITIPCEPLVQALDVSLEPNTAVAAP